MNYYNPYFGYPYYSSSASNSLFSNLFKGLNFSKVLSGTQKTLNIVNQTIPIVKQLNPVFKNAKTMFKIMNEFKKNDTPVNNQTNDLNAKQESTKKEDTISVHKYNNNSPTFFL